MSDNSLNPAAPNYSQDFFQLMFDATDLYSSIWQPMLTSIGRWNLEVAGLGLRHGQETLKLAGALARSTHPSDWTAASLRYWDQVSAHYAQSSQRLAATVHKSVEKSLTPSVVPMPIRQHSDHDMIVLPEEPGERKVA